MDKYDVSLVLACYNEAEIFNESVARIMETLDKTDYTYEIIFVEDVSRDNTRELIAKALKKYSRHNLSAIYHDVNQGRGKTVSDGFAKAQGKYVGYIDIDLEVGEWYLPKFLSELEEGNDLVNATRIYDFQLWSLPRWLASKGYTFLRQMLLGLPFTDTEAGYKWFRREKLNKILPKVEYSDWFFDTEILALAHKYKLKAVEVPVAFVRNKQKTSTVRLIPDSIKFLKNLISYSISYKRTHV
jgi:glycosyltransferase involved in cell wall biosynthesis